MEQRSGGVVPPSKSEWRRWFAPRVPADVGGASASIVSHLARVVTPDDAVVTFSGMEDEPDLSGLLGTGATFALTRTPTRGPLTVHPFTASRELHPWGFSQPAEGAPTFDVDKITIVLVPAVALGRDGSRLGHGKGYYDELLARMPRATRIGVTWECRVTAALPEEPHDVQMHAIATELGVRSVPRRSTSTT